jgi:hypothetical protein
MVKMYEDVVWFCNSDILLVLEDPEGVRELEQFDSLIMSKKMLIRRSILVCDADCASLHPRRLYVR